MNKIVFIFLICLIASIGGYSQFVNTTTSGSATTLQQALGAFKGKLGLIMPDVVTDTTTANTMALSAYAGSWLLTSSGGYKLWYRTLNPNIWTQVATGSVPTTFSPIQGYGMLLTGSYPNITFTVDTTVIVSKSYFNNLGVKYSDTASMLSNYLRQTDTSTMLSKYLRKTDTSNMLLPYLRKSDTSSFVFGYVRTIGVTTANGVSGTSSGGQNPLLSLTLGNITPTSVNATGSITSTGDLFVSTLPTTAIPYIGNNGRLVGNLSKLSFDTTQGFLSVNTASGIATLDARGSASSTDAITFNGNRTLSMLNTNTTNNNITVMALRTTDVSANAYSGVELQSINSSHANGAGTSSFSLKTINNGTLAERMYLDASTVRFPNLNTSGTKTVTVDASGNLGTTTTTSGTVTSVAVSGANGIGVSGSPITSSGTIALSLGDITPTSVLASGAMTATSWLSVSSLPTNALLYVGQGGRLVGNLNKYSLDTTQGFLAVNTSTPLATLDARGSASTTDAITFNGNRAIAITNTNGTNGNVTEVALRTVNTSSAAYNGVALQAINNSHTAGSENSGFSVKTITSGTLAERMYLEGSTVRFPLLNNSGTKVVTVDASGNLAASSSTFVNSVAGTSNQVLVNGGTSAQSGDVTLSLPQSIATSSNVQFGTVLGQATTTYSSGTTYGIASNPTTTFSGTLPSSNASFSSILAPFNNVISDNTTVNGNTPYGAVLASNLLSFSNASYRTLTMSNSSSGIKANSALIASTFDAGSQRGNVTASAGIMVNGIFKSGTYSIKRNNHYQLLINPANEFSNADSVTNKWGIYQMTDSNYFSGPTRFNNANLKVNFDQNATTLLEVVNADNTNTTSRARFKASSGTVTTDVVSISTLGGFVGTSSNHPLALITNGNSGITISTSSGIQFNAYGAGTLTTDASGNITASSDSTLKNIIRPVDSALTKIAAFKPAYYKWKQKTGYDTANVYVSLIAQSVKQSFPEGIGYSKDSTLTVQDRAVLALAIKAIQELKEKNESLEARLAAIEAILQKNGIK